jgi:ABC-type multidrug transport system permease subunit
VVRTPLDGPPVKRLESHEGRALAIVAHDLRMWRRAPWAVAAALLPPLAMAVLLYVLTLTVGRQPIALVVESHGRYARAIEAIIRSETNTYLIRSTDRHAAQHLLRTQQVAAMIAIPSGFDQAVASCRTLLPSEILRDESYANTGCPKARLELEINNVDHDFSDDLRRAVARSAAQFDAPDVVTPASEGELDLSELNPYRVNVMTYELRSTTVDYLHYSVIPVFVLLIINVGVVGTALLCAWDVERGTARYLALAPVPRVTLVGGRLAAGAVAALALASPFLAAATVTGVISVRAGHWPALGAIFGLTAVCAAGLGAALGAVLAGARQVAMTASVLSTYLFFLGGGFTTIQFLPLWLRRVASFVPTKYAIDGLRQALFYRGLHGLGEDLAVLGVTAAIAVLLGTALVRRGWSR